jgi:hypothetical protein
MLRPKKRKSVKETSDYLFFGLDPSTRLTQHAFD